jgi:hypothetical protein
MSTQPSMRVQQFQIRTSEILAEITVSDLHEQLVGALNHRLPPLTREAMLSKVREFRHRYRIVFGSHSGYCLA